MSIALIVVIGWLYVTVLMAAAQPTVLAGLLTLIGYGLLPVSLLWYLFTTKARRRKREAREQEEARTAPQQVSTPVQRAESDRDQKRDRKPASQEQRFDERPNFSSEDRSTSGDASFDD